MYIVLEFQTNEQGQSAMVPATMHADAASAESAFYMVCAAAAVSSVYKHTAMLINSDGEVFETKLFRHGPAEPEETAAE